MSETRSAAADQRRSVLLERLDNASETSSDDVAELVARCLEIVDADAGYVATLTADGRTVDVARVTRFSKGPARLAFPVDSPYPLAHALRTREPLFIGSNERLACDHPGLVRIKSEDHACATLPLVADDGTLLGALNLGFEDPHEFAAEERELIELIGRHCALAMAQLRTSAP